MQSRGHHFDLDWRRRSTLPVSLLAKPVSNSERVAFQARISTSHVVVLTPFSLHVLINPYVIIIKKCHAIEPLGATKNIIFYFNLTTLKITRRVAAGLSLSLNFLKFF